jgi:trigger factor
MQVTVEHPAATRAELSVTVEAAEIDNIHRSVLKKLAKQVRLPGYRPGKAPARVVLKQFGPHVQAQTLEQVLDKYVPNAIDESGVKPVAQPRLKDENVQVIANAPFSFVIECDIMPVLTPTGFKNVSIPLEETEISEDDISQQIAQIQKNHAEAVAAEGRAAEIGDRVEFRYFGKAGDEDITEDSPMKAMAVLGETELVPSLHDALVGAEIDKEIHSEFTYPDDFPEERLRGLKGDLKVTVESIQKIEYPDIGDELAQSEGFDDLAALQDAVRQHLINQRKEEAKSKRLEALYDHLLEKNEFEVPDSAVQNYARTLENYLGHNMASRGVPQEVAAQMMQEQAGEALRVAQRQVRIEHLLLAIQTAESIEVESGEVDRSIELEAESMGSPLPKVKARYNDAASLMRVEARVLREKTIALILGDENPFTPVEVVEAVEETAPEPTSEPEETTDNSDATDASESDSTTEDTADAATEESPEETA